MEGGSFCGGAKGTENDLILIRSMYSNALALVSAIRVGLTMPVHSSTNSCSNGLGLKPEGIKKHSTLLLAGLNTPTADVIQLWVIF